MPIILDVVVFVSLAVLFMTFGLPGLSLAPWVLCSRCDLARIDRLSKLAPGATFYELGCGTGRVARYIATHNPAARVIGIELAPLLYVWAKVKAALFGPANLEIRSGNALDADLSDADVVYTFALIKTVNEKLKPKFIRELKPGARILSYAFDMRGWEGVRSVDKPNATTTTIFVYGC